MAPNPLSLPTLEILPADVRAYERKRGAGEIGRKSKGPTIRRELGQLVAALNHAVDEGRIKAKDIPAIPLPEEGEPREMWWTEGEMEALFAAAIGRKYEKAHGRIALFVHLGYYTAARKAAIEGMEWGQVDFGANVIRLAKAGRRRTKKRRATIAMHPRLRAPCTRACERSSNGRTQNATRGPVGARPWGRHEAGLRVAGGGGRSPARHAAHAAAHQRHAHAAARRADRPRGGGAGEHGGDGAAGVRDHVPEALAEAVGALR